MKTKKKPQKVWVVVRNSPDVARHLTEIRGIFKTVEAARECRQDLWDAGERPQSEIRHFFLLDTL